TSLPYTTLFPSGTSPVSNIQPNVRPEAPPKRTAKMDAVKKSKREVISLESVVNTVIISKANTAKRTPSGSTTIPSHFKIFAGLGFNFDCRKSGKIRSEEHTSELQSRFDLVCRLLLEKKKRRIPVLDDTLSAKYNITTN